MKRITWLFLLFLIPALMPGLTTKSSSKYTFNWNERFPVIADSIHHQAQAYYQSKNLFAPQGKSESNKDYIIRMLNTYSEVKHHEFDPFIPYYQRMFSSSESEVTLTGEKYELSPYDAQAQEFTIYVRFGQDTISNTIKMKMDLETSKVFWQNWNKYNKKATFITGFDGLYIPVKFHIWNADHSFDTTITPNPIMFSNYDYNTLMVPIRNFNLYLFEPYKQAEYLFNPIDLSTQYTDFHLNCRSVVSNLMVNRLIGRTSFNRSTGEYNISKWYETILPHNGHEEMLGLPKRVHFDMTKPDSIVHFKDKIEWQSRKTSGISPEGRLFIHQSQDGMYIYDFDSGKRLLKVCDGFKNDGTETFSVTYAFDPFRKLIYMASNDSMHVYDIMQEKFIQDISQIYEICTSNSYQYMAYWRRGKLFLQLRDFINNREIPMSLSETVSDISDVKFSPDDRLLAVMQMVNETGYQYCLSVFDTRSGKELMHRGLKTYITSFVFAKDGQNIIYKDESSDCTYLLHLGIKPTDVTP